MKYMKSLCYKCGHSWNYKGKITEGKKYITCSRCYYKIRIDRALDFSTEEHQKLLSDSIKLPSLVHKLPTTHYSQVHLKPIETSVKFEEVRDPKDNFLYRVDEKIVQQFKVALDEKEIDETPPPGIEPRPQEQTIETIPWFEIIRVIPYDPLKHLEHQKDYNLNIANI